VTSLFSEVCHLAGQERIIPVGNFSCCGVSVLSSLQYYIFGWVTGKGSRYRNSIPIIQRLSSGKMPEENKVKLTNPRLPHKWPLKWYVNCVYNIDLEALTDLSLATLGYRSSLR